MSLLYSNIGLSRTVHKQKKKQKITSGCGKSQVSRPPTWRYTLAKVILGEVSDLVSHAKFRPNLSRHSRDFGFLRGRNLRFLYLAP